MNSNDYSNQYWTWRIERLLDLYFKQAGEPASIVSIEPGRNYVINLVNGRKYWQPTKDYYYITVTLDRPIQSVTRLRHKLDQTVNADVRIAADGATITLSKRPMYEAPPPPSWWRASA